MDALHFGKVGYTQLARRPRNTFLTQKYVRHEACVEVSHITSQSRISRVLFLCCLAVEAVTLQNTRLIFSRGNE